MWARGDLHALDIAVPPIYPLYSSPIITETRNSDIYPTNTGAHGALHLQGEMGLWTRYLRYITPAMTYEVFAGTVQTLMEHMNAPFQLRQRVSKFYQGQHENKTLYDPGLGHDVSTT